MAELPCWELKPANDVVSPAEEIVEGKPYRTNYGFPPRPDLTKRSYGPPHYQRSAFRRLLCPAVMRQIEEARQCPFRALHYTISYADLIGGGRYPRPGEISLAHQGSLFLDELLEFGSRLLEMLRQPLEDKIVAISRSAGSTAIQTPHITEAIQDRPRSG